MADPVWSLAGNGVTVAEHAAPTRVLRVNGAAPAAFTALGKAFGIAWPVEPTTAILGMPTVLWMSPVEWAIIGAAPFDLDVAVAKACAKTLHHLADVGDGRAIWRIEGPRARDFIAQGCSLDLHPRAFGVGRTAQSVLAQANILLWQTGPDTFEVMSDVSYVGHLRAWFTENARG